MMEESQTMGLGMYLRENIVRALRKMPTTISTSILSSSPPSHKPTWKAFPLELSCPKVETRIKKMWKVGKGKGRKENGCDANLKIPFSPLLLPFLRSGQISRHNSSGPLATPASFHAETGLSALSDQPSKTKI